MAHLPDPVWTDGPKQCLGCGYSLDGLAAPGICPECGAPFDAQNLVIHGVPASSGAGAPFWRRVVWIVLIIAGAILSQLIGVLVIFVGLYITLAMVAAVVAAAIGMFVTGPRERRTIERFILTSKGIARVATKIKDGEKLDSVLIPIQDCDTVLLDRTSAVWYRLRIGKAGPGITLRETRFDAGIRCPDAHADTVRTMILARLPLAAPRDHPPTTPQALPGSPSPPPLP